MGMCCEERSTRCREKGNGNRRRQARRKRGKPKSKRRQLARVRDDIRENGLKSGIVSIATNMSTHPAH